MAAGSKSIPRSLRLRRLGRRGYLPVWEGMRAFTASRGEATPDEIWIVEHEPVYTQGVTGKPENVLAAGSIPVVQSDRGGQVTYHGPGQLVLYTLLDLRRLGIGVKALVDLLERAAIGALAQYGVTATARPGAPGVYVGDAKIASLGLRVRQGCSYHGLSLNVDMDLRPFSNINPCGYAGLRVTQLADLGAAVHWQDVAVPILAILTEKLGYPVLEWAGAELPSVGTAPGPDGGS